MKLVEFAKIVETEQGPVLVYKENYDKDPKYPFGLVIRADLENGDTISSQQKYEAEGNRNCDFSDPDKAVRWVLNQITKCQKIAERGVQL